MVCAHVIILRVFSFCAMAKAVEYLAGVLRVIDADFDGVGTLFGISADHLLSTSRVIL